MAVTKSNAGPFMVGEASDSVDTPTTGGSNTEVWDVRSFHEKTFYFTNTADDSIDFQVQAAPTPQFNDVYDVGSVATLADGSSTTQRDFATLNDYHAYVRVNISAQSGTSSGTATVFLRAQEG